MLEYVLCHREAIDTVTQHEDLRKYELSNNEWKNVQQLHNVLKILKDATVYFSRSMPNLASVIPAMDHINNKFMKYARDRKYTIAIYSTILLAKKTLNRYYTLTDDSDVYRITMVLHPWHKLAYFKHAGWRQAWIDTTEELVHDTFIRKK
ncbi:hypothetical protein OG21DRAFT_1418173 [Imleria badia]|nr:hypothetical protein OG21DRAFT_1418173 [Imleria badia]